MTTSNAAAPAPARKSRWLRIVLFTLLALVLLLVIVFFVVTSQPFFKGVILPQVSKAMNASVTVQGSSIGLSKVNLTDLKVQTTGSEPLVTAQRALVRYSLSDIIGGKMTVGEVLLESPTVTVVYNPDGSSNLDPILKGKQEPAPRGEQPPTKPAEPKPSQPSPPGKPAEPAQVNLKKLDMNNATVRVIKNYEGGYRDQTTISGLNVSLRDVANGATGKLTVAANLAMQNNPPPPATNGTVQAALTGDFSFALAQDLAPQSVKGATKVTVSNATGALADASGITTTLNCDTTPTQINDLAVRFLKGDTALGQLVVNGPFDMSKTEGRLNVQARFERQLLNLVGAKMGMDFGQTTISSTNQVALSNNGKVIALAGAVNADKFSVTQTNQTTPPLDLNAAYNLSVDQLASSALINQFTARGVQKGREILTAGLSNPMKVAWGNNTSAAGDATLNFKVTDFDFAEWKVFLGDIAPAGTLNANGQLLSQQSGKLLNLDLSSQLQNLTAMVGSNQVKQLNASLSTKAAINDLKKVALNELRAQLGHQGQPVLTATASGTVDLQSTNADLTLGFQASLPRLVQIVPQTNLTATAGNIDVKARVLQDPASQTVTGNLGLTGFTGKMGDSQFQDYSTTADLDLLMKGKIANIRKLNGTIQAAGNPGGTFAVNGTFDTSTNAGQVSLKLTDLNQHALRPFLQAALGDKKLVSVALNGTADATLNPEKDSPIKADFKVTNLVVDDPQKQVPKTPLETRLALDASMNRQVLELRKVLLGLTPTPQGKNELQLSGKVDMTDTNAMQGGLKLTAESLDLTTYYDLFTAQSTATNVAAAPAPTPPATQPQTAPPQTKPGQAPAQPAPQTAQKPLPFRNFSFDANIGRLVLRAIDITNFIAAIKLDTNRVTVQPLQLALNGALMKSTVDLNLGVPGYQYDISFIADKLPVGPLMDTFKPEAKGVYKGEINSNLKIAGIGTTGADLKKSLNGQVQFALTNGNFQVVDPLLQKYLGPLAQFLKPVALFLGVPELVNSPLQDVSINSQMGQGNIQLTSLNIASPTFILNTAGTMPIADVLTNSPFQKWPVNFSLGRNLAEKVRLVPSGTPPDAKYVQLPSFLSVGGTLGSPDPQINKMALAGTLLEKFGSKIPGLDEKTGSLLQGLGTRLTQPRGTNQAPATGTNAPSGGVGGLLKGLGGFIPGAQQATNQPSTATNQPGTTTTNKPARPSLFDLLPK